MTEAFRALVRTEQITRRKSAFTEFAREQGLIADPSPELIPVESQAVSNPSFVATKSDRNRTGGEVLGVGYTLPEGKSFEIVLWQSERFRYEADGKLLKSANNYNQTITGKVSASIEKAMTPKAL